jgi:magnesium transporter
MALAAGVLQPQVNDAPAASITARLFDAKRRDRELEVKPGVDKGLREDQLLWIDVDNPDDAALATLREVFALPEETTAVMASKEATGDLLRYPERVHLRMVAMETPDGGTQEGSGAAPKAMPVDVVVAPSVVITSHHGPVSAFKQLDENLHADSGIGALDAAAFLTILVDAVLDVYLLLVEQIERRIDALDESAVRPSRGDAFIYEVVALRRRIAILRRALAPHRWAFAPLARPDFELEGLGKPWPGIVDRLERTVDSVENARQLLIGSFDVYMATSAQRTNDVMKVLTILSAILLPAVVLAGIMGMNFRIDFFESPANFWLAVGAMLGLALTVLAVSRWRAWL